MSAAALRIDATLRIDKLLWYLRFASSRALAQQWVRTGHMRLNGQRVVKPASPVAAGDILILPLRTRVLAVEIIALPHRRGPAAEAQGCYRPLSATDSQDGATA